MSFCLNPKIIEGINSILHEQALPMFSSIQQVICFADLFFYFFLLSIAYSLLQYLMLRIATSFFVPDLLIISIFPLPISYGQRKIRVQFLNFI